MAGTKAGGLKAAATNKKRNGDDFYIRIGAKGGRNGHTGGFASKPNPELSRIGGTKSGQSSKQKRDSLFKLDQMMKNNNLLPLHKKWLRDVYNFIEERK